MRHLRSVLSTMARPVPSVLVIHVALAEKIALDIADCFHAGMATAGLARHSRFRSRCLTPERSSGIILTVKSNG